MSFLKFLGILLVAAILGIGVGFYILHDGRPELGHKIIGFSVLSMFFVIMPLFIWHRYKDKDLSKFKLNMDRDKDDDPWNIDDKI